MQYFTIQARSNREAIEKMKSTYGEDARILTHRAIRMGGFLGLFAAEGVEVTGYLSDEGVRRKKVEVEEEKKRILESVKKEQTLQLLLKEIQGLRESIQARPPAAEPPAPEELTSLKQLEDLLVANEFAPDFTSDLVTRARRELSLETLENFALLQNAAVGWIGECIAIDPPLSGRSPRVLVIVGPTGVGKTTTIAKLAAIYGIGDGRTPARKVRIITIDNYRIAAKQQIETYAEIMRIPVNLVESASELRNALPCTRTRTSSWSTRSVAAPGTWPSWRR